MRLIDGPASTEDMSVQAKPGMTARKRIASKRKHANVPAQFLAGKGRPAPMRKEIAGAFKGDARNERPAPKQTHGTPGSFGRAGMGDRDKRDAKRERATSYANSHAGDGRLERPAPRYASSEHGADELGPQDAGGGIGDLRERARTMAKIRRRSLGNRSTRRHGADTDRNA